MAPSALARWRSARNSGSRRASAWMVRLEQPRKWATKSSVAPFASRSQVIARVISFMMRGRGIGFGGWGLEIEDWNEKKPAGGATKGVPAAGSAGCRTYRVSAVLDAGYVD